MARTVSHDVLEEALRQRPDDWERWLVYADWLTEQGDARGELIVLEHQRATSVLNTSSREEVNRQIKALTKKHQRKWKVPKLPKTFRVTLHHGFIVGASAPLEAETVAPLEKLLQHKRAALLRQLRLDLTTEQDAEEWVEEMFEPGYVPPPVDVALIEKLLAFDLTRIRSLAVAHGPLTDTLGVEIVGASQLASLRTLDLRFAHVGDATVTKLTEATHFGALEELSLRKNHITAAGVQALARAAMASNLRVLDLRENPIGVEGARALAESEQLSGLERLLLYRADVGADGVRLLAGSSRLPTKVVRYWRGLHSGASETPTVRDSP